MKRNLGPLYSYPVGVWLFLLMGIPLCLIFAYSFFEKGLYGGVVPLLSLHAYRALANSTFLSVALMTSIIAVASTAVITLLALPTAYFIARSRFRTLFLFLVIIPFWINFLVRIYAWIAILGNNGILNSFLVSAGLVQNHIQFLYNKPSVILVTVYTFLPYAILPLYASIEKFDFQLLEAARDLGATSFQAMVKVLMPCIQPGIVTALLFTFIPSFGSYAIPQIIGGRDSLMLGNIVARELTVTRNWPLA